MKRIFSMMIVALTMVLLSACSGTTGGYSKEKCEALKQKIDNHQKMTEADYNVMIDQLGAMVKYLDKKDKEIGDDKDKVEEWGKKEESAEILGYTLGFALYIEQHKNDLSASNVKKMNELERELKTLEN